MHCAGGLRIARWCGCNSATAHPPLLSSLLIAMTYPVNISLVKVLTIITKTIRPLDKTEPCISGAALLYAAILLSGF